MKGLTGNMAWPDLFEILIDDELDVLGVWNLERVMSRSVSSLVRFNTIVSTGVAGHRDGNETRSGRS